MKARPARFEPIALATNDSEKEFAFSELELHGDALQTRVRIRSHGFAVEKDFTADDLPSVVKALREMSSKLQGDVRFGAAHEDDEIVLSMNGRGQLFVRGRLVKYGKETQRLEFQFRTDQTALAPFVSELESFLAALR